MSNKIPSYPKRHFKNIDIYDIITDCVRGSDGVERTVTMMGWHWRNLDWIEKNCELASESFLVDIAERERERMGFDDAMQGVIYRFIKTYDDQRQRRNKGEEIPDVATGNA